MEGIFDAVGVGLELFLVLLQLGRDVADLAVVPAEVACPQKHALDTSWVYHH